MGVSDDPRNRGSDVVCETLPPRHWDSGDPGWPHVLCVSTQTGRRWRAAGGCGLLSEPNFCHSSEWRLVQGPFFFLLMDRRGGCPFFITDLKTSVGKSTFSLKWFLLFFWSLESHQGPEAQNAALTADRGLFSCPAGGGASLRAPPAGLCSWGGVFVKGEEQSVWDESSSCDCLETQWFLILIKYPIKDSSFQVCIMHCFFPPSLLVCLKLQIRLIYLSLPLFFLWFYVWEKWDLFPPTVWVLLISLHPLPVLCLWHFLYMWVVLISW